MRRPLTVTTSLVAAAALAGTAYYVTTRGDGHLPPLPDLRDKPAHLVNEVRDAYRRARRQPDQADRVAYLGMVLHANFFYDTAERCYRHARELGSADARLSYYLAVLIQSVGESEGLIELLRESATTTSRYIPAQLRLGDAQRASGQLADADATYRACLGDLPVAPFARAGLARVAMERRDFRAAEAALRAALDALPQYGAALDLLAVVQGKLGRDDEARATRGRAESARRGLQPPDPWLDELYKLCSDPGRLIVLADAAVLAGDGARASRFYQQAMQLAPANARVRLEFGIALIKQEQYADAIPILEQAIDLDAQDADAHVGLAAALMAQGRLDAAEDTARRAAALAPDSASAHNSLGAALTGQGRIEEAAAAFAAALTIDPDHTRANVNMAHILSQAGQLDAAAKHYRHALSIAARDDRALVGLGAVLARQNRLHEAADTYRRALRVRPDSAGAHYDLGVVLAQQGQVEQAVREYCEAIRIEPGHFAALVNLGAELTGQGRLNEAIARYRRALLIQPDSADLHNNLGFAYAAQGDREQAAGHYRRAIEIDPSHEPARENLDELEAARRKETSL